jgi:hypothetical protein
MDKLIPPDSLVLTALPINYRKSDPKSMDRRLIPLHYSPGPVKYLCRFSPYRERDALDAQTRFVGFY